MEKLFKPPKDIVEMPELRLYTDDFGTRHGDNSLIAVVDNQIVGAVWTRIMNDYGHVDDETPSFAISLCKDYRGLGIGTKLMKEMLSRLKLQGLKKHRWRYKKQISLFVCMRKLAFIL